MWRTMLVWLVLVGHTGTAQAGTVHACDDGSGTRSYQTLPCAPGARTVATIEVETTSAETMTERPRAGTPPTRAGRGASVADERKQRPASPAVRTVAFACRAGGREWIQVGGCEAASIPAARRNRSAPATPQRQVDRKEACRTLRREDRGAPDERAAQAAYRRNLLRERAGC